MGRATGKVGKRKLRVRKAIVEMYEAKIAPDERPGWFRFKRADDVVYLAIWMDVWPKSAGPMKCVRVQSVDFARGTFEAPDLPRDTKQIRWCAPLGTHRAGAKPPKCLINPRHEGAEYELWPGAFDEER
jgi:hypothetical protein